MNTRSFMILLVAIGILGAGLAGVFAAGVAVGKTQNVEAASNGMPAQSSAGSEQQFSGQLTQEQRDQLRQQFQGQGGGGGAGGRGRLSGTIESIEGNTITIGTGRGPLQATIGPDTIIQTMVEGTTSDLGTGVQVTVTGQRGDDGTVEARSVLVLLEGAEGLLSAGGRRQRDSQAP